LIAACGGHVVVVLLLLAMNMASPDRWWWGAFLMYLPQALWALPSGILLPLAWWQARRWALWPAVSLALVAGPLMGWCWGSGRAPEGVRIRVMTYNVRSWVTSSDAAITQEITDADPDILCLQDAPNVQGGPLGATLKHWQIESFGEYVIASKFPMSQARVGDLSLRGEPHTYLTVDVNIRGHHVTVSTAHFVTPRDVLAGLRSVRHWRQGIAPIEINVADRLTQARALARYMGAVRTPLIVAGDFNAPVESLGVRTLTDGGLRDAFSEAGWGYGYTFGHTLIVQRSFLRLDHILISHDFAAMRARVGRQAGSDHRPVIADLVLLPQRS
jgi:vancomycin resistance protein VanJ